MAKKPPLLPEETLRRVLRTAGFDGRSVLFVAGAFAILSATVHDIPGAFAGVLVAAGGAIELHGAGLLRNGARRGMNWLVGSQLFLLTVIWGYVRWKLDHADIAALKGLIESNFTAAQLSQLKEAVKEKGMTTDEALRAYYGVGYGVVCLATLLYQGGLAFYYSRRRAAVAAALGGEE